MRSKPLHDFLFVCILLTYIYFNEYHNCLLLYRITIIISFFSYFLCNFSYKCFVSLFKPHSFSIFFFYLVLFVVLLLLLCVCVCVFLCVFACSNGKLFHYSVLISIANPPDKSDNS